MIKYRSEIETHRMTAELTSSSPTPDVSPAVFAEWFRRQGRRVVRTASSYWTEQASHVYQAIPYHWTILPSEDELVRLLRDHKAVAVRYSTPVNAPTGRLSYHTVYEGTTYDFPDLCKSARNLTRKGLKNCSVEPIDLDRFEQEGWRCCQDTLERHGLNLKSARAAWSARCRAAAGLPGFEAWGALVKGQLAAALLTFQLGDWCCMLAQQCRREFLDLHVSNALIFVVTQTMVGRPRIRVIQYGLHSLDAPESVDEFKFRMGYSARPVRQRVVFHPLLTPLVNPVTHALVRRMLARRLGHDALSKTEGMIRFYLEGQRPLGAQVWPAPLRKASRCLDEGG
jgi:hypothetical protein